MRYVDPRHWPLALGTYVAVGAAYGLPWLEYVTASSGLRGSMGTLVAINLALPLAAILVAAAYPRLWTALVGGPLLAGAFVLTRLLWQDWHLWVWSFNWIAAKTS